MSFLEEEKQQFYNNLQDKIFCKNDFFNVEYDSEEDIDELQKK